MVFTFPGQGSYSHKIARELSESFGYENEFRRADEITNQVLGCRLLPLLESGKEAEQNEILRAFPELDQVVIFVTSVLIANTLQESGLRPELLLGHSFGELAALTVAGVCSFDDGLRIVCQRSAALRTLGDVGRMAAASCGAERAAELIYQAGGEGLQISVTNSARQTVMSGRASKLEELGALMNRQGIGLTILKARYPFHSALLQPAVEPFRLMLCAYTFHAAGVPVYLCTERRFYSPDTDVPAVLTGHLTKRLDFAGILHELHEKGYREFVECGAGNIVTKITNESGLAGVVASTTAVPDEGVRKGCDRLLKTLGFGEGRRIAVHGASVIQLKDMLRNVNAALGQTSRVLQGVLGQGSTRNPEFAKNGSHGDATPEASSDPVLEDDEVLPDLKIEVESCEADPVAIVAIGCILPGARDAEQYWHNIETGVSGIVDLAQEDPSMARDFLAGKGGSDVSVVSDKTYTLLHGSVGKILYDGKLLSRFYSETEFATLTRAEKLLALATAQAIGGANGDLFSCGEDRVECVLGATADGCAEYDDALFPDSLATTLEEIEADPEIRRKFSTTLRNIWGEPPRNGIRKTQNDSYAAVMRACNARSVRTYIVDAACSSSLYAISLGVKALQDHSREVMLVGGVFAPGPANNTLFAQFRGLTPTASRPFDSQADGVVFGDGAGILVLKRLGDAMAAGDRVLGVIRAVSISSDGRSPAINVPQAKGQVIAIHKAYERSHIDRNSIQYVEAHATATPVGDAVEFDALKRAMTRDSALPPIQLGSVKALIGHTGWAAGVASVIKLCKAFEKKTIPPQFNYTSPNAEISLRDSPFVISTAAQPWPVNAGSLPRRAGINGFGFGGTNAHLILEEFKPAYHKALCARVAPASPKTDRLAVIAAEMLFPASDGLDSSKPTGEGQFRRSALRLPKGKMLLPDVRDHMDAGQYVALLAAERALGVLGERVPEMKDSIGVVTGVESKTERGIHANQRIFLDRLKRRFAEFREQDGLSEELRTSILNKLCAAIQKKIIPSGPYTLPGLMPNVISGRVANMFDLNGPNVVVDMGANSFFQAVLVAREFLAHEDCKAILAGGINALRTKTDDAEAAGLLLLTTEKTANDLKLPTLGVLCVRESAVPGAVEVKPAVSYRAAQGSLELLQAITTHKDCRVFEPQRTGAQGVMLEFQPTPHVGASKTELKKSKEEFPASSIYSYVQGTPIYFCTPVQVRSEVPAHSQASGTPLRSRNVLFLIDQPEQWKEVERSGALQGTNYHVLCTTAAGLSKSTQVDVTTDQAIERDLARLTGTFDAIVAAKFLESVSPDALLTAPVERELELVDLLFSVCRHNYEQIRSQKVSVVSVCIGAFTKGKVHPITGLFAGFLKSLGRELPDSTCRSINVAETEFSRILALIEAELTCRNQPVEVAYRDGIRSVTQLARVERVAQDEAPLLSADSVVLATGGGRGVTAVLAEELQTRFGCTVIAVGRTDTASLPPEILRMTPEELDQYEQEFYKIALQKGQGKKITQLRDQFRAYQSAHEVHGIAQRLSGLPGRFEYISADLTDRESTTRLVESCIERYGRIDLVVHGAGIQISKVLSKKTLSEFRSVVRAKLASLEHVYAACEKYRQDRPIHYHILTSAFSYMGNDGQPDYGAANEALNRIADVMNDEASEAPGARSRWCSVGWLGWAGIGMTRGSEFAALAANRSLRGITKPEGQEIFSKLLVGRPTAAINILMADGEIKFYGVALTKEPFSAPTRSAAVPVRRREARRRESMSSEHAVNAESVPYVLNHLVDGIPTLPGAYLIMLVAQAAMELRPGLQITAFEDASFRRFVRLRSHGSTILRLNSKVVSEDETSTLIHTAVLSDFTHKSGVVLQKDVIQTEIFVRMASSTERPNTKRSTRARGRLLNDPYVMEGSPVHLNGPFRTLNNIVVGESDRSADFSSKEQSPRSAGSDAFLPNLLIMDSLWRFGAIDMDKRNSLPVYVPEACRVMRVYYNLAEPKDRTLNGSLTLSGSNPVEDEDKLVIGPVEVRDATGSVLLTVEGGVCRKLGEVQNGR